MNALDNIFNKYDNECEYILKLKQQNDKIIIPPKALGEEGMKIFAQNLEKYYGEVEIADTTSLLGKHELLKARYNQFIQAQAQKRRI